MITKGMSVIHRGHRPRRSRILYEILKSPTSDGRGFNLDPICLYLMFLLLNLCEMEILWLQKWCVYFIEVRDLDDQGYCTKFSKLRWSRFITSIQYACILCFYYWIYVRCKFYDYKRDECNSSRSETLTIKALTLILTLPLILPIQRCLHKVDKKIEVEYSDGRGL